jgi:subtilisin family serine protease
MNFKKSLAILALCLPALMINAQKKAPENWFTKDPTTDKVNGTGSDAALKRLKEKGKKGKTIIVAVLDSGVDYKHEDLKDIMWTNPGEIPGNGIDDDGNGYIDDVHGWNFLGGKDGKNVDHDSYELTREYVRLKKRFENTDPKNLHGDAAKEYKTFEAVKTAYESKRSELEDQQKAFEAQFGKIEKAFATVEKSIGKKSFTADDVAKINAGDNADLKDAVELVKKVMAQGLTPEGVAERKEEASKYFGGGLKYGYNTEFNPRTIIGDNYEDLTNRHYGNNDYRGPDASHGTHVAGIIAAKRDNGIGINGIADNVQIMSVRCVPDGDERDKDVANAIYYAVDNGASIVNMSFGKGYSPHKEYVDAAMRYAAEHDVLIVHAAGNDSDNNDTEPNFPNAMFKTPFKSGFLGLKKEKTVSTWMEIGALNWRDGEKRVARFSNYGKKNVDLFSPGQDIYSSVPDSKYASFSGTSMASPAAAGVAAIIRSYYPELSARQVKDIMDNSVVKQEGEVLKPGSATEKVKFSDLCLSGGIVSATNAIALADTTKGKKVKKAIWRDALDPKMKKAKPVLP